MSDELRSALIALVEYLWNLDMQRLIKLPVQPLQKFAKRGVDRERSRLVDNLPGIRVDNADRLAAIMRVALPRRQASQRNRVASQHGGNLRPVGAPGGRCNSSSPIRTVDSLTQ